MVISYDSFLLRLPRDFYPPTIYYFDFLEDGSFPPEAPRLVPFLSHSFVAPRGVKELELPHW